MRRLLTTYFIATVFAALPALHDSAAMAGPQVGNFIEHGQDYAGNRSHKPFYGGHLRGYGDTYRTCKKVLVGYGKTGQTYGPVYQTRCTYR